MQQQLQKSQDSGIVRVCQCLHQSGASTDQNLKKNELCLIVIVIDSSAVHTL